MVTRFKRFFGPDAPFVAKILGVSLALHIVAAIFSLGQHSADEHFQVLEFLNFKLGLTPPQVLAVEYGERMRPWFQPGFYFLIAKALSAIGVVSPFIWAFFFRLASALIGWLSLALLAACVPLWFQESGKLRRFAWSLLGLLWYLPALHARTSSENFSGSFFLIGLCVLVISRMRRQRFVFLAGLSLGLAFESRFQAGVMIAGLCAWLIFRVHIGKRSLLALFAGLGVAIGLGRVIDFWGYGEWVMSPLRYVDYNLIRNEVNRYHQSPWWDVFRMSFTESWPLLGFLVTVLSVVAWVRRPNNALTWSYLPFFLLHCLIGHKELRFFFPIASGAAILIPIALGERGLSMLRRLGWGSVYALVIVLNYAGLAALCTQPFSRVIYFQSGLYAAVPAEARGQDRALKLWTDSKDPYEILGTDTYFYRAREYAVERAPLALLERDAAQLGKTDFLFVQSLTLPAEFTQLRARCERKFSSLPDWVTHVNINDWLSRTSIWTLWRCGKAI